MIEIKQRLITAGIGLVLFFVIMFCYETVIFDIALCLVSLIAVHELLLAAKVTKNIPLTAICMLLSIAPFVFTGKLALQKDIAFSVLIPVVLFTVIAAMFLILLCCHEKLSFEKICTSFFVSLVVPFSIATLVYIRNEFGQFQGLYYTLVVFACAWGSDSGAYFVGRFFGKKKLAPKISPNKTVEGVYGGIASSVVFMAVLTAGYYFVMQAQGVQVTIHYLLLLFVAVAGSLVGVLGDLTASAIKRQYQIKDFGSIMPGHGGVLDRFDSVLFVAPFLFVLLKIILF